jgi:hypothetical protein
MNAAAATRHSYEPALDGSLKKPLITSALFHLGIFLLTIITVPFITKDPIQIIPVSVELVSAVPAQKTAAPPPPTKDIEQPKPPEELLAPPKPEPPPPPEPVAEPEPEVVEPVKEEAPKPKPKPPEPKPKPKPKEEPKKDAFEELLKDFTPRKKTEDKPKPKPKEEPKPAEKTSESAIPDFSREMTRSELEAVQGGISPCWSVDGGSRYAENLIVKLKVTVYPDMRVKTVSVVDQIRYTTDRAFRAAADAASRALRNPRCSTLRLPPEKYKDQSFEFTFDPREMLGY